MMEDEAAVEKKVPTWGAAGHIVTGQKAGCRAVCRLLFAGICIKKREGTIPKEERDERVDGT